jgi:hypothetical protein
MCERKDVTENSLRLRVDFCLLSSERRIRRGPTLEERMSVQDAVEGW